ncbi:MAG: hypothetical protein GC190_20500 [Alphaproteobacteria bacterium]|nr:hypothetical protein [Alphaproteobacteria bacterium]
MAIFGCPNCRIQAETDYWPRLIVKSEPYNSLTGAGSLGSSRLVCLECRGPLQSLSARELREEKYRAIEDMLAQRDALEPTFLDLVIVDHQETAGASGNGTSGNPAGVDGPIGGQ